MNTHLSIDSKLIEVVRRSYFTLQTAPAHVRNITNLWKALIQTFRTLMCDVTPSDSRKSTQDWPFCGPKTFDESLNSLEYIHDKPGIFLFIFMIDTAFLYLYSW